MNCWRLVELIKRIKGGVWRHILNHTGYSNEILEVMSNEIWKRIGGGSLISFWEHKWVGDQILKYWFPRLYVLSNQKKAFFYL